MKGATARAYRCRDLSGDYVTKSDTSLRSVVERFWENPDAEDCTSKIADFFLFPEARLGALVNGAVLTSDLCAIDSD